MQINNVEFANDSTGGAVSNKAVGTAFIAVGCVTGSAWSLGSHVHTLVAAPMLSLGCLGAAGAMGAGGYMMAHKKPEAAKQTVDTTATAVA